MAFAFEDAGSTDEEERALTDFDGGNVKGVFRQHHLVIESQPGVVVCCTKVGPVVAGATIVIFPMYHRQQSHIASGAL